MIKFEKVSFEQFVSGCKSIGLVIEDSEQLRPIYDNIKLPKRSTSGSAGYDFYMPFSTIVNPTELTVTEKSNEVEAKYNYVTIPTGIRWISDRDDVVLLMFPRSGLGVKNGFKIRNTTGVIDSDYWKSDNEGHIFSKITVEESTKLDVGKAFMQAVIFPFVKTDDDNSTEVRNGGFGSTDAKPIN